MKIKSFQLFLLIILILQAFVGFGQRTQVSFINKIAEIKDLKDWENSPAIYQFVNNGNQKIALLKGGNQQNVTIELPEGYIQPKEKGEVHVYYHPLKSGPFEVKIQLYSSDSDQPIELIVKGNASPILECPTFDQQPIADIIKRDILIVDKNTEEPIPNATISLIPYLGTKPILGKTSIQGKFSKNLPFGMYQIKIQAKNYQSIETALKINRSSENFIYELEPSKEQPEIQLRPKDTLNNAIKDTLKPQPILKAGSKNSFFLIFSDTKRTHLILC